MKRLLIVFVLMLSTLEAGIDKARKVYAAKNFKKAFPMFEQLSKEGNIESNYYLGNMYQYGNGVERNDKKAFIHYSISANKDNNKKLKSKFSLALMYSKGIGIKEDNYKAFSLLESLDNKNIGVAQFLMGMMYSEGKGAEKNMHKAIKYFEKGCNNKYAKACYFSGFFYENGIDIGLEEAYLIAKGFYEKGCELNFKKSCEALKTIKDPRPFYRKYFYYIFGILTLVSWWRLWRKKKRESLLDEKQDTLK